jgi:hypothetical protein
LTSLPRRLKRELVGHDARTAPEMGWASKSNGELLAFAAGEFDVFLIVDRIFPTSKTSRRCTSRFWFSVGRSNALDVLRPLVPLVLDALANPKRGAVTLIRTEGDSQASRQG